MPTTPCALSILIPVNSRPRHLDLVLAGIAALRIPALPAGTEPFRAEVQVRHTGPDTAIGDVVQAWQSRAPVASARDAAPARRASAPG